ncbi:site-specific integrase [Leeuwenhoekiella marinoflava]|uniref:Site-specific recombinase XerD n=2 Tax=Leeuwenhoekiella marinoflava TaxID=988 RepID=A0A4Q0PLJ6_9FLAO|nr:site-specific integrase [Leeuwenhoekiella marinoflava]RXG29931.1 site-specific recombinase XerD [Leeuwenhoekiella marinoflava]SHF25953.1 Site-specific recombinase XerD [Leeuwenhoekiella marinoflava DSM 3653]
MKNNYYALFHLIKRKINKRGLAPIYLRLTVDGKRKEHSISRRVDPRKWNSRQEKALGNSREAVEINTHISNLRHKLNQIHQNYIENDKYISANSLIKELRGENDIVKMTLEIFKEHNENLDQLIGKDISKASAQRYWTCYNHIQHFIKEQYKEDDFRLKDIDYNFITKFEHYLKTKRNCNHNSALKYVNNFKKIIRIALANKWMDHDPLINYRVKFEPVEREFLSQEEVDALCSQELHFDRLKLVRDMFIFSCYTGLAYSDVEKLSKSDITLGIDGSRWIRINRTKTGTKSSIPLLPVAEQILERYENHPEVENSERVIPVFSNQKSNAFLKEIAIMCGITKPLTTHLARHTFATTITLTNGVPIETVSKMLGHQSLRTTQHYAKIVDRKISDDMNILKAKLAAQKSKKESKME